MTHLWYLEERHNVAEYLGGRGWTAMQSTMAEQYEFYGQPLSETGDDTMGLGSTIYVTVVRS